MTPNKFKFCHQRFMTDLVYLATRNHDDYLIEWSIDGEEDFTTYPAKEVERYINACSWIIVEVIEDRSETRAAYGQPVYGLDLNALRGANKARLPLYYANGCPRWDNLSQWSNATLGELGEAANIIKKVERGDFTLDEARPMLAKEFADVLCYLDLLAMHAGVDLSEATVGKFNEVSERVGSDVRLFYQYYMGGPAPETV